MGNIFVRGETGKLLIMTTYKAKIRVFWNVDPNITLWFPSSSSNRSLIHGSQAWCKLYKVFFLLGYMSITQQIVLPIHTFHLLNWDESCGEMKCIWFWLHGWAGGGGGGESHSDHMVWFSVNNHSPDSFHQTLAGDCATTTHTEVRPMLLAPVPPRLASMSHSRVRSLSDP